MNINLVPLLAWLLFSGALGAALAWRVASDDPTASAEDHYFFNKGLFILIGLGAFYWLGVGWLVEALRPLH